MATPEPYVKPINHALSGFAHFFLTMVPRFILLIELSNRHHFSFMSEQQFFVVSSPLITSVHVTISRPGNRLSRFCHTALPVFYDILADRVTPTFLFFPHSRSGGLPAFKCMCALSPNYGVCGLAVFH